MRELRDFLGNPIKLDVTKMSQFELNEKKINKIMDILVNANARFGYGYKKSKGIERLRYIKFHNNLCSYVDINTSNNEITAYDFDALDNNNFYTKNIINHRLPALIINNENPLNR